jgi:hypothetical protein
MKTWNEYFGGKPVNEDHKQTKKEQIEWICETLNKLTDEQVKMVYEFIEDKLDLE